jgi:enamine deaminase RidA (YjgF/YER057c/UK114 family)
MNQEVINSTKAPDPVGLYPHARRVGNLLFLSGVGPRERGTKKIPGVELDENGGIISYEIEAQCRSVSVTCVIFWRFGFELGKNRGCDGFSNRYEKRFSNV